MAGFIKALEKVLNVILMIVTAIVVFAMIWGVFTRSVLNSAAAWTDEVGTMLLVWITLIGSVILIIRDGHLDFDLIVSKMPPLWARITRAFGSLLIAGFSLVLAWGGWQVTQATMGVQIISLDLPKGLFYAALPVTGVLAALVLIVKIWLPGGKEASGK